MYSFCVCFPTFTQPSLFCRTIFFNALHKDGVVWLHARVLTFCLNISTMENLNILFTRNQESIPITTNSGKKDGSR